MVSIISQNARQDSDPTITNTHCGQDLENGRLVSFAFATIPAESMTRNIGESELMRFRFELVRHESQSRRRHGRA